MKQHGLSGLLVFVTHPFFEFSVFVFPDFFPSLFDNIAHEKAPL